jgi:uncharacterized integral membrane protein
MGNGQWAMGKELLPMPDARCPMPHCPFPTKMKTLANLVISLVVAIWVVAIAIISVQNATPVSLKFFTLQSIQIPVGLVLAFSAGVGIIGVALLQPLWGLSAPQRNSRLQDDAEFFVDDEDF